ncbi:MAG: Gfo/Idh/MocA family protein [Candidatus Binatia bacterium]
MNKGNVVKAALIGIGGWSTVIADAVKRSKKVELVTCFTRTPEKRRKFSEKYECDEEKSFEDLIKRDDVDAVLLTTPNAMHAEHAVLAARHGKHVFVDKPIANTMVDGKKIVTACEEAGVVLLAGHDMRRLAGNRKAKVLIDGGAIGDPIQVEANFSHALGFELTPDKFRWHGDDSGCPAGSLMTMGIHHVDTLNYFFGPIKSAFAYFNKLYIPADVEDVTATIFEFESGVLGYLGSNYASPKANWIYVYGTKANLLCLLSLPEVPFEEYLKIWPVVDRYTKLLLFEKGKDGAQEIPLTKGDPILEEIDEFADCIQTGARPETDGEGALVALALIRAAIDSARTGKQAKVEV